MGNEKVPGNTEGDPGPAMTPWSFLKAAIEAVPSVKFALGVGGIAAVIAIVAGFLDLRIALVGIPLLLVMMIVLVVFSNLAAGGGAFAGPAKVLVWFATSALVVVVTVFAVTFFVQPQVLNSVGLRSFYQLFNIEPSQQIKERSAASFIREFQDAVGGVNDADRVAEALDDITTFWRQPEQQAVLQNFRCSNGNDETVFVKAAEYVFATRQLMEDVDTVSRYFNAVAVCALREQCASEDLCATFYWPMEDFRMLYGDYFARVYFLEARNPMGNVKTFLSGCTSPPADEPLPDRVKECATT